MNADQPSVILKMVKEGARERWASSFKFPQELWKLEFDEALNLALYVSKVRVIQDRWNPKRNTENPHGPSPIYHVWQGDEWLYCGPSIRAAYNKFNELKGG